ncbi:hypothetical protein FZEAL_7186 [Fusarium zealandicum]|uniref:Ankyrin repeat protein n=1 Tax=Fusarium zealandicum TaxID=1053134 RepID=A0A8H4UH18_9HYPO|nr:hypothetical protein FZEAL_7186 [Fusarium zealandicum]
MGTGYWLQEPLWVTVWTGNAECATSILRSQAKHPADLLLCKAELICEAAHLKEIEFVRLAIETVPPFTAWPLVKRNSTYDAQERDQYAVDKLCRVLETTTDPQVFELLFPFMTATCKPYQRVWWESRGDYFETWGTKRLQRAMDDGVLPIVQQLLHIKFSIGPQPLVGALERGHDHIVRYLFEIGARLDGALAVAAKEGNVPMLKLLLEKGAGKNKESMKNALREALMEGEEGIFRRLVDSGQARGVFNNKGKECLKRDLLRNDMIALLKLI